MAVTTEELKNLIDSGEAYTLIDLREEDELTYGMLPTAQHIPLAEFKKRVADGQLPFAGRLIVYCRSGGRSAFAVSFAQAHGIPAENYAGGVLAWSKIDSNVRGY